MHIINPAMTNGPFNVHTKNYILSNSETGLCIDYDDLIYFECTWSVNITMTG